MAANKKLVIEKHAAVRAMWEKLSKELTKTGAQKHTYNSKIEKIATKHFYTAKQVENVLFYNKPANTTPQQTLF